MLAATTTTTPAVQQGILKDKSRVRVALNVRPTQLIVGDGMLLERGPHEIVMLKSDFDRLRPLAEEEAQYVQIAQDQLERKRVEFVSSYKGADGAPDPVLAERAFPASLQAEYRLLTNRDMAPIDNVVVLEELPPAADQQEERALARQTALIVSALQEFMSARDSVRDTESNKARK